MIKTYNFNKAYKNSLGDDMYNISYVFTIPVFKNMPEKTILPSSDSPINYLSNITVNKTVLSYYDQIIVVFTDNKNSRFVEHFQNSIMEYICTEIPEFRNNDEIKLMISYMLYGTYHILSKSDYNKERLIKLSSKFALVLTNI